MRDSLVLVLGGDQKSQSILKDSMKRKGRILAEESSLLRRSISQGGRHANLGFNLLEVQVVVQMHIRENAVSCQVNKCLNASVVNLVRQNVCELQNVEHTYKDALIDLVFFAGMRVAFTSQNHLEVLHPGFSFNYQLDKLAFQAHHTRVGILEILL